MNPHLKLAYDHGVQKALEDAGLTKAAGENDTLTKILGAVPVYGPALASLSGAALSPDGRGSSRGMFGAGGSALGQVGGVVGGGLAGGLVGMPLALIARVASKGRIRPEDVVAHTAGIGGAGGLFYGGYKGTGAGLEESRRGDTLLEKLRQLSDD